MEFHYFDAFVALLFVFFAYKGFKNGLVLTLASLGGVILGVYGAMFFSDFVSDWLVEKWEIHIPILSFALTFTIILVALYFLGKIIEKGVKMAAMGPLNKILGILFNVLRVSIYICVALALLRVSNQKYDWFNYKFIADSYTYIYFTKIESGLLPYLDGILQN